MRKTMLAIGGAFLLLSLCLPSQADSDVRLIKDMTVAGLSSNPEELTAFNGRVYFRATDPSKGAELFVTDGTPDGTSLLADINAGSKNSNPSRFTPCGPYLFFTAEGAGLGYELWKTDGTADGTTIAKDMAPGADSSLPQDLVDFNGLLIFRQGTTVWRSDGTNEGTFRLTTGTQIPRGFTRVGNRLFFLKNDDDYVTEITPIELWSTDGTVEGTSLIKSMPELRRGLNSGHMTELNGQLYFYAQTETEGKGLWKSDGTPEGTEFITSLSTWLYYRDTPFFTFGNQMYIDGKFDGATGYLIASDGTADGTHFMVEPASAGPPQPDGFRVVNGKVIFLAYSSTDKKRLWGTDGTAENTVPISTQEFAIYSTLLARLDVATAGGKYYFAADGGNGAGIELWQSDGASITMAADIMPGAGNSSPNYLCALGDSIVLAANGYEVGEEPYISDGSAESTALLKNIAPNGNGKNVDSIMTIGDWIYIDSSGGLTRSDGTAEGTERLLHATGNVGYSANEIVDVNGLPWFSTYSSILRNDGTVPGNTVIWSQPQGDNVYNLDWSGTYLAFSTIDTTHGREPWISDGTGEGTTLLLDVCPGGCSSDPGGFYHAGDLTYFSVREQTHGRELWITDGKAAGTSLLLDTNPGTADGISGADMFHAWYKGHYYFSAQDPEHGRELWRTDGTPEGTVLFFDLVPGSGASSPKSPIIYKGDLYFATNPHTTTPKLWKTDGTLEGTEIITDQSGKALSFDFPIIFNGLLLFAGNTTLVPDDEPFRSDGTSQGTYQLADVYPGNLMSIKTSIKEHVFAVARDRAYFPANDGVHGTELWETDGTPGGTRMSMDIYPGKTSGDPAHLAALNGSVYFIADDGYHGRELWGATPLEIVEDEGAVEGNSEGETTEGAMAEGIEEGSIEGIAPEGEGIAEGPPADGEEGGLEGQASEGIPNEAEGVPAEGDPAEGIDEGEGENPPQGPHAADQNSDNRVELSELLRIVQFHNSIGGMHCDNSTEDGFATGPGNRTCTPHSSDYAPQDWDISLSELLRLIQLYNVGSIYPCGNQSEDGFCDGPA